MKRILLILSAFLILFSATTHAETSSFTPKAIVITEVEGITATIKFPKKLATTLTKPSTLKSIADVARKKTTKAGSEILLSVKNKFKNLPANWFDDVSEPLLKKMDDLATESPSLISKLQADLANPKWADELKTAFKDNPADIDIWKKLKDDPASAWDISKTNPDWKRWGQREFFKEATAKGKAFERFVENNISSLRSKLLNKYPNLDISEYEIFTQVQIKTGAGSEYFVADMVLVKKKIDDIGQVVLDKNNVVVLEAKLNSGTNLTTLQGKALTKVQSNSNTFDIRSVSKKNANGYTIRNSDNLKINDFIKVYSNGNGNIISDVISLK